MTSCKLPRHVHCKSNQHVSLRHALCKNRSKLVLQTAENRLQLAMKTISRLVPKKNFPSGSPTAPKFLQYSSKMPARCLQNVSKPPTRRPQIVCEATQCFQPSPRHAKDLQSASKTSKIWLEASSRTLQVLNICHTAIPPNLVQSTTLTTGPHSSATSAKKKNSELTHIKGSAALA